MPTTGMPLGILPRREFETSDVCLKPGDKIVAFSDGLSDAENADQEHFGTHLKDLLEHSASGSAQQIHDVVISAVKEFSAMPFHDDVTILIFEFAQEADSD